MSKLFITLSVLAFSFSVHAESSPEMKAKRAEWKEACAQSPACQAKLEEKKHKREAKAIAKLDAEMAAMKNGSYK